MSDDLPAGVVDDLVDAADDGVELDGLVATSRDGETYGLAVPDASYDDLSEPAFRETVADHAAYVREWHFWRRLAPRAAHRWAFLRWVEGADERPVPERREALADGLSRPWGQLRVTATAAASGHGGDRVYEVRHEGDAGEPAATLETHHDPADAAAVARYDDDGDYRPLSTAPTLRTGWVFDDLGPSALVRTIDGFYPATVANWYREREGRLDVTHWREAAERQTGIYDVVDELGGGAVATLAETCCVDAACLKRRAWDESGDEPLDVPRGDGEFPCREPCSLVIDAARELALQEGDEPAGIDAGDGG